MALKDIWNKIKNATAPLRSLMVTPDFASVGVTTEDYKNNLSKAELAELAKVERAGAVDGKQLDVPTAEVNERQAQANIENQHTKINSQKEIVEG